MAQVSWRAPDGLVEDVRRAAAEAGRSMNEFISETLRVRVDPEAAGDEVAQLRERLARAGLLVVTPRSTRVRPDPERVAAARRAAGRGQMLSAIVSEQRG